MSLLKCMYQAKKVSGRVYVCSLYRKEVYVHIEVHVPSQEGERSCACVLGESILPLFLRISVLFLYCSDGVVFFVFLFISQFRD